MLGTPKRAPDRWPALSRMLRDSYRLPEGSRYVEDDLNTERIEDTEALSNDDRETGNCNLVRRYQLFLHD
jgi:hypothetical protein